MCEPSKPEDARISADKLLDLGTLADALASNFANPTTHPQLWGIYRANAYKTLAEHIQKQPISVVMS